MGTNPANKISINCMEMIQQNLLVRLLTLLATLQGVGCLFRIDSIACEINRWNCELAPVANQILDICNYTIRMVDESSAGRGIYKLDVYTSSDAEICIPDNCETLHSVNYSTTDLETKGRSFDITLAAVPLVLVRNTCGQMYLVANWTYRSEVPLPAEYSTTPLLVSSESWPFKVMCEPEVDVFIAVEIEENELFTGIYRRNITLTLKSSIHNQIPGFKLVFGNANTSKSDFSSRTSQSVPQIWIFLRPQSHALWNNTRPNVDALQYRLGDVILRSGNVLFNLKPGQSSPALVPGESIELNRGDLSVNSGAVCGEAWMIFLLDPFQQLPDTNTVNNFVAVPVFIDCWAPDLMEVPLKSCEVIPDEFSLGKTVLMLSSNHQSKSIMGYQYKTDDRSFRQLHGDEKVVRKIASHFQMIQNEKDRLMQLKKCPNDVVFQLPFNSTLFGYLFQTIEYVTASWNPIDQSEPVKQEHMKVTTILHALKNILKASAAYDTIPARFVDSVLNGLYSYWPVFPFGVSSVRGNITLDSSWHVRLSNTVLHFMRSSLYPDFYGQPNSNQVLQNFLNQLVWSSDGLQSDTLSYEDIAKLRQVLLWILEQQMPRCFDRLLSNTSDSVRQFFLRVASTVPVTDNDVVSALNSLYQSVENEAKYNVDHLIISFISTIKDTPSIVHQMTLIFRKIQENIALNKFWILMEGHSDTSFDGNLQCRLYALRQLQRLQNPSTEKNWDINIHLITMWKTGPDAIYRGDISSITGRLYWNRVAICYCDAPDEKTTFQP